MRNSLHILALVGLVCGARLASGAMLASDEIDNYGGSNPAWANGTNQGSGFGAWSFTNPAGTFFYPYDATTNAGAPANSGNINSSSGNSFGSTSGPGALGYVDRPFLVGGPNSSAALAVGQSFSFDFDNGYIASGGSVGISLKDSVNSNNRFEFYFHGGDAKYTVAGSSDQLTAHGFTGVGMNAVFTLTSTDTYAFSVHFLDSPTPTTETFTGTLQGTSGGGIDGFRFFNYSADYGATNNQYFNHLAIASVPEPTTLLGIVAVAGSLVLRRRRTN